MDIRFSRQGTRSLPPMPREHGAWLVLLLPMALGLVAAGSWSGPRAVVMPLSILAAFVARESVVRVLRRRADASTYAWAIAMGGGAATGGLWCVLGQGRAALLLVAGVAAMLLVAHITLTVGFGRARYDRSLWGELLGVAGLTLGAPAAFYAAGGHDHMEAWRLWAASALYFAGGVLHVKMLLGAMRLRAEWRPEFRLRVGRANVIYHLLLAAFAGALAMTVGGLAGALAACAYVPAVWRALYVTSRLSGQTYRFVRVGIGESAYAAWFAALYAASLHLSGH